MILDGGCGDADGGVPGPREHDGPSIRCTCMIGRTGRKGWTVSQLHGGGGGSCELIVVSVSVARALPLDLPRQS